MWIGALDDECEPILSRVDDALRLIKTYDLRRYHRLLRDLDRIWVHLLNGNVVAQFNKSLRACEIDIRFMLEEDTTSEVLAGVIVHEATHARLEYRGIEYLEPARDRIEKICVRQELLFASKLPDGQRALEFAQYRLESTVDRTDAGFQRREIDGMLENLRYTGAPEWLVRCMGALLTWAERRNSRRQAALSDK